MRLHRQHEQHCGVHISGLGSPTRFETALTVRLPAGGTDVIRNDAASMRTVKTGVEDSGMTAVEGINPGDVVATRSFNKLPMARFFSLDFECCAVSKTAAAEVETSNTHISQRA